MSCESIPASRIAKYIFKRLKAALKKMHQMSNRDQIQRAELQPGREK